MTDKQKAEAKRLRARVEQLTGEWFCVSGQHRTTTAAVRYRGRRVCTKCHTRISASLKASRGKA